MLGGDGVIFHPRLGQQVRIHYNRRSAAAIPYHGETGVVRIAGRGPGPRNVGVEIGGQIVVVPRGNLVAVAKRAANESTPALAGVSRESGWSKTDGLLSSTANYQ